MSSTEPAPQTSKNSDLNLSFLTIVVVSVPIMVATAAYGVFALGMDPLSKRLAVYLAVAIGLSGLTIFCLAKGWRLGGLTYVLAVLIGLEALLGAKALVKDHRHHLQTAHHNHKVHAAVEAAASQFQFHPMLGISPRPNWRKGGTSNTADGLRTTINTAAPGAPKIALVGGSTTYDIFAQDKDTWASKLAAKTGFHVDNLGVSNYSSADHIAQTAFQVTELRPVCAVYYVGWNDLRNNGQKNIRSDYANYNLRSRYRDLASIPTEFKIISYSPIENSALGLEVVNTLRLIIRGWLAPMSREFFAPSAVAAITSEVDPVPLGYFVRNMKSVIAINRANGVKTVLIPQVLNDAALKGDDTAPWVEWVRKKDVPKVLAAYNGALLGLGGQEGVWTIDDVLRAPWKNAHFDDEGHMNAAGDELFAATIAPKISEICGR